MDFTKPRRRTVNNPDTPKITTTPPTSNPQNNYRGCI